jgi:6-phosphogluconolactonase
MVNISLVIQELRKQQAQHPNWQVHALPNTEITQAMARDTAQRLAQAITQRGQAVLAVSGGKSPIALFEALRQQPINWSRVTVTLVDERCVSTTHEASNAYLVQTHLLKEAAAQALFIGMISPDADEQDFLNPEKLALLATDALGGLGNTDVMILGMGADGHTASLFPDAPNLQDALDLSQPEYCLHIALPHPPANAPFARITQTLRRILDARHLVLPLAGEDKLAKLQSVLQTTPFTSLPSQSPIAPIAHVLAQPQTSLALWISL